MIHIFRKEIKKSHIVLWAVLISLALSSLTIIFQGGSKLDRTKIAAVNGVSITFKEFQYTLNDTQRRIDGIKSYARMLGISEDIFLQSYYQTSNPHEIALKTAIKEKLIDQVRNPFDLKMADEDFREIFFNGMPEGLLDERGRINMSAYNEFVRRLGVTPDEFEARREAEIGRQLIERFVANSFYLPHYYEKDTIDARLAQKSFLIAILPYQKYLDEVKKSSIDQEELKKFYEQHKNDYRVAEKRKAFYWRLNPTSYANRVTVDEEAINTYYNKNQSSLFRIPPKVRIRSIVLTGNDALNKAKKIHEAVQQDPGSFVENVKNASEEKESSKNNGLTDFFARGTHDKAFEDAAFRLVKVNDISDIVKTSKGYEILKLEERISASEEPLEKVKDRIVETLRAKKSLDTLKSDLEIMLHNAKKDTQSIEKFVAQHNLKKEESALLSKESENKHDLSGRLAEKLFSTNKRLGEQGYLFDGESYVIYKLAEVEKPFTRNFSMVTKEIEERYYNVKAQEALAKAGQDIKTKVLNKEGTLENLIKQEEVKLIQTELIKQGDHVKEFKEFKEVSRQAFQLIDKSLILKTHVGRDYCLIQLQENVPADLEKVEKNMRQTIKQEIAKEEHTHVNSFIASLQINAKIERFDEKNSKNVVEEI